MTVATPLLTTRLFIPPRRPRDSVVARSRLTERLSATDGQLEGLFTTMFLRRIYARELRQLAALAEKRPMASQASAGSTRA